MKIQFARGCAILAMLFCASVMPTAAQATPIVTNGTFDNSCADWSFGGFVNFCTSGGNPGPSLVLNDGPGPVPQATQLLTDLIAGQVYDFTFDAKTFFNCCNNPATPAAGVGIDGQQFDFLVVNNQPWTTYSFSFTYGGGSQLLVLSSQRNGTDSDAQFDNVSIVAQSAAIPEPSTLLLLSLGLLGVGFAGKRRSY